jgi:hypothetical protein
MLATVKSALKTPDHAPLMIPMMLSIQMRVIANNTTPIASISAFLNFRRLCRNDDNMDLMVGSSSPLYSVQVFVVLRQRQYCSGILKERNTGSCTTGAGMRYLIMRANPTLPLLEAADIISLNPNEASGKVASHELLKNEDVLHQILNLCVPFM